MKIRRTFFSTLTAVIAAAPCLAAPTAVEHGAVVQAGLQFQKTIVLDQTFRTEGGDTLLKGSYEVRFESLPGNKARATFFQGGVKRGEAEGIIILGGTQAGPLTRMLMENSGIYYFFRHDDGKHQLVLGQQGKNQILIGLLPPGAATGVTPMPQKLQPAHGAQKVQPPK